MSHRGRYFLIAADPAPMSTLDTQLCALGHACAGRMESTSPDVSALLASDPDFVLLCFSQPASESELTLAAALTSRSLPVVALSAAFDPASIRAIAELGCAACHAWPIRDDVLAACLQSLLARRRRPGASSAATAENARDTLLLSLHENLPGACVYRMLYGPHGTMSCAYVSPNVEDLIGVSAEHFRADATRIFSLLHPADVPAFTAALRESLQTGAAAGTLARARHARDGSWRWLRFRSRLVAREPDGTQVRDGVIVDVTAETAAQQSSQERESLLSSINANLVGAVIYRLAITATGSAACTYVSPGVQDLIGLSVASVQEDFTRVFEATLAEDRPLVRAEFARAVRDGVPTDVTVRILHSDGGHRWIRFRSHCYARLPDGGQFRDGLATDVTALHVAQEKWRETQLRLELALRSSRTCTWENDVRANRVTLDATWREMLGHPPEPLLIGSRRLVSESHPEDRTAVMAAAKRAIRGDTDEYRIEHRVARADGGWLWILSHGRVTARDVHGRATRIIGTNTDIHARKAAEAEVRAMNQRLERLVGERTAELRASETRFRALFQRSPIPMGLLTIEGSIVELNDAALATLGQRPGDLVGRTTHASELWENPAEAAHLLTTLWNGEEIARAETSLRRGAHPCFPALVSATVIEIERQRYILATIQDLTLRKQSEQSLARAHHRVTVLAQLGRELAEAETPRRALLSILEAARQLLGWDCCWLQLWNEETRSFDHPINFDLVDGERREVPSNLTALQNPSSIILRTMHEGPQLLLRATEHDHTTSTSPFGQPRRSLSLLFVPIKRSGRLLGIVSIQSYTRDAYDAASLDLLVTLADHCAGALARIQARAALVESEERFQLANRATFDVIWDQNLITGKVWWNEHFEQLFGHSREEAATADFWRSCLHPDDRQRVVNRVAAVIQSAETTWSDHYRFRRRNGSYAFVEDRAHVVRDAAGRAIRLLGAMQDRTEETAALAALEESEERFRTAFAASPIPILVSGVPRGDLIEVNAAALTFFGYTREDVIGRNTAAIGIWAKPEQHDDFFRRLMHNRTVHGFEAVMRDKQGTEHFMLCTGTVLTLGRRTCILTSAVDITAVRQAEAEKADLHERLYQRQKFEALGTLAGGVAHDFNNILTGVINFTALARDECPPGHPCIREYLDQVLTSGQRAKNLTRQILLFSRAEDGKQEVLQLQSVLTEALPLLRSTLPASVEIQSEIDSATPPVLANATQLHQVIMNLGVNAAQALLAQRGQITVRLRIVTLGEKDALALPDLRPGRFVVLEVADTGTGMTDAVRARVFEPFFTTKPVGSGTGLGLAVVHSVVRSHHGAITVQTELGRGSTFSIYLPAQQSAAPALPRHPLAAAHGGHGERILLVDDETIVADSVGRLLGRLGYRVTYRDDPRKALDAFRAEPSAFDIVITDLQMPGLSGFELAQRILQLRPEIPVIVASGYTGDVSVEQLKHAGVFALIEKPFSLEELSRTLTNALPRPS